MALSDNSRGAIFMALAMASFTFNDALVKSVTPFLNIGQIMFVRGAMTTLLVYLIARKMGALRPISVMRDRMVLLRTIFEILATTTFLTALGNIPLGNVSSILQSLPLAVTLGAAIFLGEPVGWRRWTAIFVGFCGVLLILRPGADGFTASSLLLVCSVLFTAGRDLATRRMRADIPSLTVTVYTALANAVFGAFLILPLGGWQPMSATTFSHLAFASVFVLCGYQTIIMAMRNGEISFVAPFRYVSLLWALLLGILFFDEKPDFWMLTGAAIVIGSGLYTFYREKKRLQRGQERPAASSSPN